MATPFPRLAARYGEGAVDSRMAVAGVPVNATEHITVAGRHAIGQQLHLALQVDGREQKQRDEILRNTIAVHNGTVR